MNKAILETILDKTRERVASLKVHCDPDEMRARAEQVRRSRPSYPFRTALSRRGQPNIIAEIKRASPSRGVINDRIDAAKRSLEYESAGACGISVLTEENYFKGTMEDLVAVRRAVDLPVLRKDFTVDEIQIYEAAAAGADAVLLIAAALSSGDLAGLQSVAQSLGMDAIVEVHTAGEMETAATIGAKIIGINNRDLRTFNVSLDVSRELIRNRPDGALTIAESGIASVEDIDELKRLGFDGFLVGESLMRTAEPEKLLGQLVRGAA